MKKILNNNYFYFVILILFFVFYSGFKPKPKVRNLTLNQVGSKIYVPDPKNNPLNINSPYSIVSVSETIYFEDKKHWYQVFLLSFWRKENLLLNRFDRYIDEGHLEVKVVDKNNYALRSNKNERFVYACLDSPNNFYYDYGYDKAPRSGDLKYWRNVYIKNIVDTIYSFKPDNYECLLVFTSNKNFFEKADQSKRSLIFKTFIPSSD